MGKAIVIPGLVVNNPLVTVTFEGVESVLAKYYAANSTINATEKAALETFVGGLLDAGLWSKVQYFYPMLGNSVADMLLDVVDPETEDILAAQSTDGLTIIDRTLNAEGRSTNISVNLQMRAADTIDGSDLSIVHSIKYDASASTKYSGWTLIMRTDGYVTTGVGIGVKGGGYRDPEMAAGANGSSSNSVPNNGIENNTAYNERIDMGDYNQSVATIYKGKSVYATGTNYATGKRDAWKLREPSLAASNDDVNFNFLMLSKHLTSTEWSVVYDLLLAYLQTLGKHS